MTRCLNITKQNNADATIAVIEVPMKEASRFGIMNTDEDRTVLLNLKRSLRHPKSNLASMGIYIFNWKLLRKMLLADMKNADSSHDFGKDIIPDYAERWQEAYMHTSSKDIGKMLEQLIPFGKLIWIFLIRTMKLDLNDPMHGRFIQKMQQHFHSMSELMQM